MAWNHAHNNTNSFCSSVGLAVKRGNLLTLRRLVKKGKPVDVPDVSGWRPLHEAAHKKCGECIKLLLAQGRTDVNWKTNSNETALHLACRQNCGQIVKILLAHGADPNIQRENGETPLLTAIKHYSNECICPLLAHGADVNIPDNNKWTAVHYAATRGDLNLLKLLAKYDADVCIQDNHGRSPLSIVSLKNLLSLDCLTFLVQLAIKQGNKNAANISAVDGRTALIWAATKSDLTLCEYLIENGADVNHMTNDGSCALHFAVESADVPELVSLILEKTDLQLLNKPGAEDPVHLAVKEQRHRALSLLLAKSLPLNTEWEAPYLKMFLIYQNYMADDENWTSNKLTATPLGTAATLCDEKSVELLLQAGANPNALSYHCMAPLTLATRYGDERIVSKLLMAGSNLNYTKSEFFNSEATFLAVCLGSIRILEELLKGGVNDIKFSMDKLWKGIMTTKLEQRHVVENILTVLWNYLELHEWLDLLHFAESHLSFFDSFFKKDWTCFSTHLRSLKHLSRVQVRKNLMLSKPASLYAIDMEELQIPRELQAYLVYKE